LKRGILLLFSANRCELSEETGSIMSLLLHLKKTLSAKFVRSMVASNLVTGLFMVTEIWRFCLPSLLYYA